MPAEETDWIKRNADLERERREAMAIYREQLKQFRDKLWTQMEADLEAYYLEFPKEKNYIRIGGPTPYKPRVTRTGDLEAGSYREDERLFVEFAFETTGMALDCKFSHRTRLNRKFKVAIADDGGLRTLEATLAQISRYLLEPILFNKLRTENDVAD